MYIISVTIFTFSIKDFGHPKFLKSQFGHPVMRILAKSLLSCLRSRWQPPQDFHFSNTVYRHIFCHVKANP